LTGCRITLSRLGARFCRGRTDLCTHPGRLLAYTTADSVQIVTHASALVDTHLASIPDSKVSKREAGTADKQASKLLVGTATVTADKQEADN
jgi:hypothetical protein